MTYLKTTKYVAVDQWAFWESTADAHKAGEDDGPTLAVKNKKTSQPCHRTAGVAVLIRRGIFSDITQS
jgi:hypothetical protein